MCAALLTAAIAASGCSGSSAPSDTTSAANTAGIKATLNGSGATFPKAFYEEAIAAFNGSGSIKVTYAGGGSGQGQQELADEVVTWAGTDAIVAPADLGKFKGGSILYFPTVAAPITIAYNVSGVDNLRLSPSTIAGLFQATIKNWNAPEIASDNPGVTLPDLPVKVVHRSDGSGTTANFTSYLVKAAPNWSLGSGKEVRWPADTVGEKGNDGVAAGVKRDEGAIGYVDFSDADAAQLRTASVENADAKFVAPTLDASAAALASATINDDLTYDPLNAPGPDAYPITAPTWVIVYEAQSDHDTAAALRAWVGYLIGGAQALANDIGYTALPPAMAEKARRQVDRIGAGG